MCDLPWRGVSCLFSTGHQVKRALHRIWSFTMHISHIQTTSSSYFLCINRHLPTKQCKQCTAWSPGISPFHAPHVICWYRARPGYRTLWPVLTLVAHHSTTKFAGPGSLVCCIERSTTSNAVKQPYTFQRLTVPSHSTVVPKYAQHDTSPVTRITFHITLIASRYVSRLVSR